MNEKEGKKKEINEDISHGVIITINVINLLFYY
jgi:hypothetical protein